jgi:hypothetical protein
MVHIECKEAGVGECVGGGGGDLIITSYMYQANQRLLHDPSFCNPVSINTKQDLGQE